MLKDKAKIEKIGVVRGRVLSYDAEGDFVFLKKTGDTLVIASDKVLNTKITKSLTVAMPGTIWHSAEFGLDWGKANQWDAVSPHIYIETNHAYVINKFIQPGIGAGYQLADNFHIMPLFFSLTGDLYKSRVTPFYFTNVGYGVAWARAQDWRQYDKVQGGLLFHIGGGLKIAGRLNSVYLKSGYRIQKAYTEATTFSWLGSSGFENVSHTIRRVYFGVSLAF